MCKWFRLKKVYNHTGFLQCTLTFIKYFLPSWLKLCWVHKARLAKNQKKPYLPFNLAIFLTRLGALTFITHNQRDFETKMSVVSTRIKWPMR